MRVYTDGNMTHHFTTPARNASGRRDSHQSVQGSDSVNVLTPHGMATGMESAGIYYPQDMSNYSSPYSSPQEVTFAGPNFAPTATFFAGQPEYPMHDEFHGLRHESVVDFIQPNVGPFMTPATSFGEQFSQPSSQTNLIALAGTPSVIRGHGPPSPASSSNRGTQRWNPYGSKPKNKRTGVACDPCRAKKQKCDGVQEGKGCQQCTTNNIECKYREVPPKATGTPMEVIMQMITRSVAQMDELSDKLDTMADRLLHLEDQLKQQPLCKSCSQNCNHLHIKSDTRQALSPRL